MRQLNLRRNVLNKKVRGKKRKTKDLNFKIKDDSSEFPSEELDRGYWHMHIPAKQSFVDAKKLPFGIKRRIIQTLVDQAQYLVTLKPKTDYKIRVVAMINSSSLWHSEIIVFFGENHYKGFFDRNDEYQKWIPIEKRLDIQRQYRITLPNSFTITGYKEIITDEDFTAENELWYLGEID